MASADAQTWRKAAEVKGRKSPAGDSDVVRFEATPARYVRLLCTKPAVNWWNHRVLHFAVHERLL